MDASASKKLNGHPVEKLSLSLWGPGPSRSLWGNWFAAVGLSDLDVFLVGLFTSFDKTRTTQAFWLRRQSSSVKVLSVCPIGDRNRIILDVARRSSPKYILTFVHFHCLASCRYCFDL